MLINIINLEKRNDRRLSLINHLEDMGCLYRFWNGCNEKGVMPFVNISNSHKCIVRDAKERGLELALIAEDDLRFSHPQSLNVFLSKIPASFDLFFGMIYTGHIVEGRITYGFSGLQFYCIHKKFYDTFLSAPPSKHLDQWLGSICLQHEFFVCDPFICGAESGYSNNFLRQWTFNEKALPRALYKG